MNSAEDNEPESDLRARLHSRHLQLQAAGPGPWPEDLVTATLNDTVALLNQQHQHAAQAAERHRAEGARVIRIVAQAGSAVLAIEATAALTGLLALGWLSAFGLLLMGTLSIWGSEKNQLLATSLFGDIAAALCEHGSATLDEHCCYIPSYVSHHWRVTSCLDSRSVGQAEKTRSIVAGGCQLGAVQAERTVYHAASRSSSITEMPSLSAIASAMPAVVTERMLDLR